MTIVSSCCCCCSNHFPCCYLYLRLSRPTFEYSKKLREVQTGHFSKLLTYLLNVGLATLIVWAGFGQNLQKTIVSCHRACNFSKRLPEPQVVSINAATVHHQTGTISSSKPLIQLTTVNVPEQVIDNSPTCRSQSNYIQLLPRNHANHGKSQFWDKYPTLPQSNSHEKHHPSPAKLQHYRSSLTPLPRLQLCGVLVLLLLKLLLQTSVWTDG